MSVRLLVVELCCQYGSWHGVSILQERVHPVEILAVDGGDHGVAVVQVCEGQQHGVQRLLLAFEALVCLDSHLLYGGELRSREKYGGYVDHWTLYTNSL